MNKALIGFIIGICAIVGVYVLIFALGVLPTHKTAMKEVGVNASQKQISTGNYKLSKGYVPNAEIAIKIAEAVWLPIYGEDIYNEKPFNAELENGIWTVKGSLQEGYLGGVAEIDISMEDGKILRVTHGK